MYVHLIGYMSLGTFVRVIVAGQVICLAVSIVSFCSSGCLSGCLVGCMSAISLSIRDNQSANS